MNIRRSIRRVKFLARAEVSHLVRDRATMVQIIVMPMVQLLLLSNVATFRIKQTPAYLVDFDHTPASRGVAEHLAASGYFHIIGSSTSPEVADRAMLDGSATLVVTIPHDFEASLVRTGKAAVDLDMNAEKGSAAGIVASYAAHILADYSRALAIEFRPDVPTAGDADPEPRPDPGQPQIAVRTRNWFNDTLDYKHYMVPGILVALVTMTGTLLTAQNIAREKETGTLEQLNVTPITKGEFIAAKLLPFWVLALFNLSVGLVVGRLVFGIPMRGNLLLLFGAAALYLVVALAIGLWISTLVETQQQAMFVTFFILMVYQLMSGLFTPVDSMPAWVRVFAEANPIRHFVEISRAVLMKGAGFREVKWSMLVLAGYAVVIPVLAVRQYSKRSA